MILDGKDIGPCYKTESHCVPIENGLANCKAALARGLKKIPRNGGKVLHDSWANIVGYGPSLKWTWREIDRKWPIVTAAGAHDFLIKRGVIPNYHVECDPRPHKALGLTPHKDVHYLIASSCHPDVFDKLDGFNVSLWHAGEATETIDRYVAEHDPDTAITGMGNSAGPRAMGVMGEYGYWRFHLFGMDCSCVETRRHAGIHYGPKLPIISVNTCGRRFYSTLDMASTAEYMVEMLSRYQLEVVPHGDNLLSTMLNEANRQLQVKAHGDLSFDWYPNAQPVTIEHTW